MFVFISNPFLHLNSQVGNPRHVTSQLHIRILRFEHQLGYFHHAVRGSLDKETSDSDNIIHWEALDSSSTELPSLTHRIHIWHTYVWLIFMVNVGKYIIHGSYGL